VDAADEEYFETEIRHLLDDPLVDFLGEIGDGEPVIAFPFGSMPELIEPGVNGAVVESIAEAVAAVEALAALDRRLCRHSFEQRFTTARMARDYVGVYGELVEEAGSSAARAALSAAGIPMAVPALVAAEERHSAAWVDGRTCRRPGLRSRLLATVCPRADVWRERLALAEFPRNVAIRYCGSLGNSPASDLFASVGSWRSNALR
jgi:hypothetical protein